MRESVARARALLERATPLAWDCGTLCGGACCAPDEDGQGGVSLLPGEEAALAGKQWARIVPGKVPLLMCEGPCERSERPFFCRLFPLIGVRRNGTWNVRVDRRARAMCPLARGGARGLDPGFVRAAREAVALLTEDEQVAPLLVKWARIERAFAGCDLSEDADAAD